MKKILLSVIAVLIFSLTMVGCAGTQTAEVKPDGPRYTIDQVIEKAKARSEVGLDGHIEWDWKAEYLPAQPDLKLKAVWKVTQNGTDMNELPVSQTTYFHEDTGAFTYTR